MVYCVHTITLPLAQIWVYSCSASSPFDTTFSFIFGYFLKIYSYTHPFSTQFSQLSFTLPPPASKTSQFSRIPFAGVALTFKKSAPPKFSRSTTNTPWFLWKPVEPTWCNFQASRPVYIPRLLRKVILPDKRVKQNKGAFKRDYSVEYFNED